LKNGVFRSDLLPGKLPPNCLIISGKLPAILPFQEDKPAYFKKNFPFFYRVLLTKI